MVNVWSYMCVLSEIGGLKIPLKRAQQEKQAETKWERFLSTPMPGKVRILLQQLKMIIRIQTTKTENWDSDRHIDILLYTDTCVNKFINIHGETNICGFFFMSLRNFFYVNFSLKSSVQRGVVVSQDPACVI